MQEEAQRRITLRMPETLGQRVDAYARAVGIGDNSEAIRDLLRRALDVEEPRHSLIVKGAPVEVQR